MKNLGQRSNDLDIVVKKDLPTVNNPTITFTQGGTTKGTITLNQSSDQTIALDAGGGGGGGDEGNLVADITLSSTASSIEITGLDINSDGGVYDFIVEGHNSTQQESSVYLRFNNLSTSRYWSIYIANNDTYLYGNTQTNVDQTSIAQFSQNECFVTGTIMLSNGYPLFQSNNWYLQNAHGIILRNGGYYNTVNNITSIRFNNQTTFATGTRIKIYKRSTNNARITS